MVAYLQTHEHKRSAERDRAIVRLLRPHFEGRSLGGLGAADVRAYMEHRRLAGTAPATINRELALLSSAINYARREWQWDIPNPVSGRKLREPEGRVRWISRAEAAALIRWARSEPRAPWLGDFVTLGLHTGMRKGEMLGLEWRRVDLQAGLIHLEAAHTKANRRRSVPLNKAAREAILSRARWRATHAPASPWVFCEKDGRRVQNVRKSFGTACRRAGIEDFHPHDLRHTCAAWLVSAGVPLPEVRDLLGHSTVKMTERYAHLAPENVRAAVAVLDTPSHDRVTSLFETQALRDASA